jgi:segregation and condensation protein B
VQIDAIRGVGTTSIIRKLVAKGFIKESGRSELPGRPILYETTHEFLDYFGLSSIEDLPNIDEFIQMPVEDDDNNDLYTSKYTEKTEVLNEELD